MCNIHIHTCIGSIRSDYESIYCPNCQNERDCLFRNLRETPKNIETLLFGIDEIDINENSMIFNKVDHILDKQKDFNQWSFIWSTSTSTNNTHTCIIMSAKIAHTKI
jgi:hypothetical protein